MRIGRAVRIPEDGLREFGRMEGGGGDAKIAESAAVYRTRPSEGRARAGHRELTPEEPGKTPERFEVIRELKYGDRKQRTGMIQVTKSELVQRTKAIDALLAFRAKQKPLGMSTEELVREGRRELERRTDRHLGLDR